MIGAVIGGSSEMRLRIILQEASMRSLYGERIVVISGVREFFPVLGKKPLILAPSSSEHTPVDVVAEYYALVPRPEAAAREFAAGMLSGEKIRATSKKWDEEKVYQVQSSLFRGKVELLFPRNYPEILKEKGLPRDFENLFHSLFAVALLTLHGI